LLSSTIELTDVSLHTPVYNPNLCLGLRHRAQRKSHRFLLRQSQPRPKSCFDSKGINDAYTHIARRTWITFGLCRSTVYLALIGVAGFVLGYNLVNFFIPDQAGTVQVIIGLVIGLIGAFLARKFTKILLLVAAFVLVGNTLLALGTALNIQGGFAQLLLFVIGGLMGLALVR
jgi:hypothetical protein